MNTINPRNEAPLSNEQLFRAAPAIFAAQPAHEVSSRYVFVPTIQVVDRLRDEGWFPVQVNQSNARVENGGQFAKHKIRFRHESGQEIVNVNDIAPEIILFNSHNAGSSFQLHAGLYRKVCANGLVIADQTFASIKAVHTGDAIGEIIEGSYKVLEEAPQIVEKARFLQNVDTTLEERQLLAEAATQLRWEEGKSPIEASRLLTPRRYGDDASDLWTVFNVVQENLVRGGIDGINASGNRTTTREVKAPQQNIGLNKALWTLAEGFAELKTNSQAA